MPSSQTVASIGHWFTLVAGFVVLFYSSDLDSGRRYWGNRETLHTDERAVFEGSIMDGTRKSASETFGEDISFLIACEDLVTVFYGRHSKDVSTFTIATLRSNVARSQNA